MGANPPTNSFWNAACRPRYLGSLIALIGVAALASGCGASSGSRALSETSKCSDWNKATVSERVAFVEKSGYVEGNIEVRGNWHAIKLGDPKLKVASYLATQVTGYCASDAASSAYSVSGALSGTALALGITVKTP